MQVHESLINLPQFTNAVLTIGSFDGVHLGHKKILQQVKATAHELKGESVLITFYPHPRKILNNADEKIALLNTWEEKLAHLAAQGIDHVVVISFTKEFSEQSPQNYIDDFLIKVFQPSAVIIGYDHKFGKNRQGDIHLLKAAGQENNFLVEKIPERLLENAGISSTIIRKSLVKGEVHIANKYLGYDYSLNGVVINGKKLGRTIGYPTANIGNIEMEKLIPAHGVYIVEVVLDGEQQVLEGMLNIGYNPTVNATGVHIEVHIFDFDNDIYGQKITVFFKKRLRDEIKFKGLEELKFTLAIDEKNARDYFTGHL